MQNDLTVYTNDWNLDAFVSEQCTDSGIYFASRIDRIKSLGAELFNKETRGEKDEWAGEGGDATANSTDNEKEENSIENVEVQ
jgi:hypothetical protein